MSFIDELKNARQQQQVLNAAWVEEHIQITLRNSVKQYYDNFKKHLLVLAKECCSNILCGEYYISTKDLNGRNLGDDIRKDNEQYKPYDMFGLEVQSQFGFDGSPNINEITEDRVTYIGGYGFSSAYKFVNDNEVRLDCHYDHKQVYVLLAMYMKIKYTSKGFFKSKYYYNVEFSKYVHEFIDLLKELASNDGVYMDGPFCTFWDNLDCKNVIREGEQIIVPDHKLSFFAYEPMITIKYKVNC